MKKKTFVKRYAKAVLLSQKIRERSFNEKKYKKDRKKYKKKHPDSPVCMINTAEYYGKDIHQSIEEALVIVGLSVRLAYPLYLSIDWWNDLHDWACEVLGKKPKKY